MRRRRSSRRGERGDLSDDDSEGETQLRFVGPTSDIEGIVAEHLNAEFPHITFGRPTLDRHDRVHIKASDFGSFNQAEITKSLAKINCLCEVEIRYTAGKTLALLTIERRNWCRQLYGRAKCVRILGYGLAALVLIARFFSVPE